MRFLGLLTGLLLSVSAFADSYVGIGITIQKDKDDFYIVNLIKDGPAFRAGVLIGDLVAAVDGKETHGKKLEEVSAMMKGDVGTSVTLLLTNEKAGKREITITREVIDVPCFIEGSYSLQFNGVGSSYSTLTGWVGSTYVNLQGSDRRVSGYIGNEYVGLDVDGNTVGSNYITVTGWIRGTYVRWSGFSTAMSGYQACVP